MTGDQSKDTGPVCGCGCCAAVLAEVAAVRHELGQLMGLVILEGIGTAAPGISSGLQVGQGRFGCAPGPAEPHLSPCS
jgi:hypothetical protein